MTEYNNSSQRIRLMFQNNNNKRIEEIVYKSNMEKIFEHIKIYEPNKQYFINIFINREEQSIYDEKEILNKINDKSFLKLIIIKKLKIKEFPLINYSLEKINNEGEIKVYILKKNEKNNTNSMESNIQINKIHDDITERK